MSDLRFPDSGLPRASKDWQRMVETTLRRLTGSTPRERSHVRANAQAIVSSSKNSAQVKEEQDARIADLSQQVLASAAQGEIANGRISYYSFPPTPEDGVGKESGSIWWEHDGAGKIIAQWEWDGSTWNSVTLSHQTISSVDLGTATVGQLDGVYIKAKTIAAEQLIVGDFTNYLNNGDFTLPLADGWDILSGTWDILPGTDEDGNPRNYLSGTGGVGKLVNELLVAVKPGDKLMVSGQAQHTGAPHFIGLQYYQQDGTLASDATSGFNPTGGWTTASFTYTVPLGAYFASFLVDNNGLGVSRWANLELRRMVGSVLIVDGAIDGKVITGALIRTAASGQRIELDSVNGLRGFNASNQVLTQLTTGGVLTATGATISGLLQSAASGQRFELNSTQLRFISSGGYAGTFAATDDGSAAGLALTITPGLGSLRLGRSGRAVSGTTTLQHVGNADFGEIDAAGYFNSNQQRSAPWAMASGRVTGNVDIANGSGLTYTVTLPASRFTQPPNVQITPDNGRLSTQVSGAPTTSSFIIRANNWSGGTAFNPLIYHWIAVQMTSASSNG